jgi:hypothetical protein
MGRVIDTGTPSSSIGAINPFSDELLGGGFGDGVSVCGLNHGGKSFRSTFDLDFFPGFPGSNREFRRRVTKIMNPHTRAARRTNAPTALAMIVVVLGWFETVETAEIEGMEIVLLDCGAGSVNEGVGVIGVIGLIGVGYTDIWGGVVNDEITGVENERDENGGNVGELDGLDTGGAGGGGLSGIVAL